MDVARTMFWLVVVFAFTAPVLMAGPRNEKPSIPMPKVTSMKGWELYYRHSDRLRRKAFGVLVGTNRQKSVREVQACLEFDTFAGLADQLRKLPRADVLIVQDALSPEVRRELKLVCDRVGVATQ